VSIDTSWVLPFIGGIISAILVDVIVKLLPISDDLRFRITYNLRKISKMIRNVPVRITYTIKTQSLESRKIPGEAFVNETKKRLLPNNFQFVGQSGASLTFKHFPGKTEVDITLIPSYFKSEISEKEEELFISRIQADLLITQFKYNQFEGHMVDLLQTVHTLGQCLRDIAGEWTAESLSCEIGRLYQFTGVLSELKLSSLQGKIQGEFIIDLSEKKVIIYGLINQTLLSILKKIITFYY